MTDLEPEPSAKELEARANLAFKAQERIKDLMHQLRTTWMGMASGLHDISSNRRWKDLGYDSFEQWLADPDIEISRRWAYDLIAIYREFVVLREVNPDRLALLDVGKLQAILPAVRRKQIELTAALADVATLSQADIRDLYKPGGASTTPSPEGAKPDKTSRYDAEAEPDWVRCPSCGSRVRRENVAQDAQGGG